MTDSIRPESLQLVSLRSDWDIVVARMAARDLARRIGFSAIDQARIATAASDLARDIVLHSGEGLMTARTLEQGNYCGIEMAFSDSGPGLSVIEDSIHDGLIPNGTNGNGYRAAQRLMDEVEVQTNNGHGKTLVCRKWLV